MDTERNLKILREREAFTKAGMKHATGWKRITDGLFPRPFKLGGEDARASGWLEHEVDAVIAAMAAGRTGDEIRKLVAILVAKRTKLLSADLACFQSAA